MSSQEKKNHLRGQKLILGSLCDIYIFCIACIYYRETYLVNWTEFSSLMQSKLYFYYLYLLNYLNLDFRRGIRKFIYSRHLLTSSDQLEKYAKLGLFNGKNRFICPSPHFGRVEKQKGNFICSRHLFTSASGVKIQKIGFFNFKIRFICPASKGILLTLIA